MKKLLYLLLTIVFIMSNANTMKRKNNGDDRPVLKRDNMSLTCNAPECNQAFSHVNELKEHLKTHSSKNLFEYNVNPSSLQNASTWTINRHSKNRGEVIKESFCKQYIAVQNNNGSWMVHYNVQHLDTPTDVNLQFSKHINEFKSFAITNIVFMHTHNFMVCLYENHSWVLWSLDNQNQVPHLTGQHNCPVRFIEFSPHDNYMIIEGKDYSDIIDLKNGTSLIDETIKQASLSDNEQFVAYITLENQLIIFNIINKKTVFKCKDFYAKSLFFTPNNTLIIFQNYNNLLNMINITSQDCLFSYETDIVDYALSYDEQLLAIKDSKGDWRAYLYKKNQTFVDECLSAITFSSDIPLCTLSDLNNVVALININKPREALDILECDFPVIALEISTDNTRLATANINNEIYTYSISPNGSLTYQTTIQHDQPIKRITFQDNENLIIEDSNGIKTHYSKIKQSHITNTFQAPLGIVQQHNHPTPNYFSKESNSYNHQNLILPKKISTTNLSRISITQQQSSFGFTNFNGVNCYANSILQCLRYLPDFRHLMKNIISKKLEGNSLLSLLETNFNLITKPMSARIFMEQAFISFFNDGLENYIAIQSDASEFFINLIQYFDVGDYFATNITTHFDCFNCTRTTASKTKNREPIFMLESLDKESSLLDCMNNTEFLNAQEGNGYQCSHCIKEIPDIRTNATKKITIQNSSLYLVFKIKRFMSDSLGLITSKNNNATPFPLEYSFDNANNYDLQAIVLHTGPTIHGGHYIAIVKDATYNRWLLCNDETVTLISRNKMLEHAENGFIQMNQRHFVPYIFFYTKT